MSRRKLTLRRGRRLWPVAALASLALLFASCVSQEESGPPQASGSSFAYGIWGEPEHADRTIEIETLDAMRFEPGSIEVELGETITFEVVNRGKVPHELTIGDEKTQIDHEAHMAGGNEGHDHPNSVYLEPGDKGSLTWIFSKDGDFLYGCHVPGHYAAGMVGTISVGD